MTWKAAGSDFPEEQHPNVKMYDSDSDYEPSPSPAPDTDPVFPNLSFDSRAVESRRDVVDRRASQTLGDPKLHCDKAPGSPEQDEGCWVLPSPMFPEASRDRASSGYYEAAYRVDSFEESRHLDNVGQQGISSMGFADIRRSGWSEMHGSIREISCESDDVWETETLTRGESLSDTEQPMDEGDEENTLQNRQNAETAQMSNPSLTDGFANLTLQNTQDHPSLAKGSLEGSRSYHVSAADAELAPEQLFYTSRSCSSLPEGRIPRPDPVSTVTATSEPIEEMNITFTLSRMAQQRLEALKNASVEPGPHIEEVRIGNFEDGIGAFPEITPETTMQQNSEGDTLLHLAIIHKLKNLVFFVLRMVPCHLALDILNNLTQAPLHLAVLTHQHEVVRSLVVRGARIDTKDRNGDTALHLAGRSGCLDCAKALSMPVHYSEIGKCLYKVPFQRIPQSGSLLNYDGQSCLHLAAASRKIEMLRYLLSLDIGHDVNIRHGRTGRTILHEAIKYRHLDVIMFLMENRVTYKLEVNCEAFDGLTPMELARDREQGDVVFLLLLVGARHEGIG